MTNPLAEEIAAAAARLVVEDGMEYGQAKQRAGRDASRRGGRPCALPSNEQVEDAVREHLELFHADTQPAQLRALREVAVAWMERLAEYRPHLAGAAWRGTATRHSALHIDLYCDDAKACEIALINAGVDFDADEHPGARGREATPVLTVAGRTPAWREPITIHLSIRDLDDQRGALIPDSRGRTWRGDLQALRTLIGSHDHEQ